ncbi:hypothetical protein [Microbacterium sp. Marseille-Q6965]|uniref:hypothetical protein n=1 Tax=Microbacterium sp. Marseille-Q6965 TaxID=2965072 RepID=UPI0021B81A02|nr:hypothetical protein [Microbacterium sp. Marseille-Q6965]
MSSDALPKTVVPSGITDEVELARAELRAALAAIEQKANFPARAAEATERTMTRARAFARREPGVAAAGAVAIAAAVGAAVWGLVTLLSKRG